MWRRRLAHRGMSLGVSSGCATPRNQAALLKRRNRRYAKCRPRRRVAGGARRRAVIENQMVGEPQARLEMAVSTVVSRLAVASKNIEAIMRLARWPRLQAGYPAWHVLVERGEIIASANKASLEAEAIKGGRLGASRSINPRAGRRGIKRQKITCPGIAAERLLIFQRRIARGEALARSIRHVAS